MTRTLKRYTDLFGTDNCILDAQRQGYRVGQAAVPLLHQIDWTTVQVLLTVRSNRLALAWASSAAQFPRNIKRVIYYWYGKCNKLQSASTLLWGYIDARPVSAMTILDPDRTVYPTNRDATSFK